MTSALWFLVIGCLLVGMGISHGAIKRLPMTPAIIYLTIGVVVGPTVFGLFHFNPLKQSGLLEVFTEVAVLISLYAAGVKMPAPWSFSKWKAPIVLATVSMAVTVGFVAMFCVYVLAMPLGLAVLLGAILAPTDPVLATDVQIRHPGDSDRLRFNLTCEAGINDGSAFPFVMLGLGLLGLHDLGEYGIRWALLDVVWATTAGVAIGVLAGAALGIIIWRFKRQDDRYKLMDDFIGLGLVGVVYGVSELAHAWGFLAVFFAAVAFRETELRQRKILASNGEALATLDSSRAQRGDAPRLASEGSLVFKEHLERISEVVVVILVGGSLFLNSWSWRAVAVGAFLFIVARPLSVLVARAFTRLPKNASFMTAWFGIRGIGSLYYLMYSIQHDLPENQALELVHITLIVVTLSILVHGISVTPMMNRLRPAYG